MYYVFYGSDSKKVREKAGKFLEALKTKRPDAEVLVVVGEMVSQSVIEELVATQGLFERKCIGVFDCALDTADSRDVILDNLKELKASDNAFLFIEGELLASTKGKLEKHAERMEECAVVGGKKTSFNIFALGDAIGARNKKSAWTLYQKALRAGLVPEEIHGTIFWQVKSMILASRAASAEEAGLNPFVFKKSAQYAKKYAGQELEMLAKKLVQMYHEARRGIVEFDLALERFFLEM